MRAAHLDHILTLVHLGIRQWPDLPRDVRESPQGIAYLASLKATRLAISQYFAEEQQDADANSDDDGASRRPPNGSPRDPDGPA